jgi:WD domain, G-beta repeat
MLFAQQPSEETRPATPATLSAGPCPQPATCPGGTRGLVPHAGSATYRSACGEPWPRPRFSRRTVAGRARKERYAPRARAAPATIRPADSASPLAAQCGPSSMTRPSLPELRRNVLSATSGCGRGVPRPIPKSAAPSAAVGGGACAHPDAGLAAVPATRQWAGCADLGAGPGRSPSTPLPDGKALAACEEKGVSVWDVADGKLRWRRPGRFAGRVAWSPDGRTLAAGGTDGVIPLWDAASGEERRRFGSASAEEVRKQHKLLQQRMAPFLKAPDSATGHGYLGWNTGLAFSQDGRSLYSVSQDFRTIFVWDVGTGDERRRLTVSQRPFAMDLAAGPTRAGRATATTGNAGPIPHPSNYGCRTKTSAIQLTPFSCD